MTNNLNMTNNLKPLCTVNTKPRITPSHPPSPMEIKGFHLLPSIIRLFSILSGWIGTKAGAASLPHFHMRIVLEPPKGSPGSGFTIHFALSRFLLD